MAKILHISDLHFCVQEIRQALGVFLQQTQQLSDHWGDLEIHSADLAVLESLQQFVTSEDPDVLVVTGDITTFGDPESFELAGKWLRSLLIRKDGKFRPCILVPGNHDVLRDHLANLVYHKYRNVPWYVKVGLRLKGWLRPAQVIRPYLEPEWKEEDFLRYFREFADTSSGFHIKHYTLPLDTNGTARVSFLPFCTVSSDPWWMNAGFARQEQWKTLKNQLSDPSIIVPGTLKILLAHHNPISSPGKVDSNIAHAYNSMPGGTEFMQLVQQRGVDIILHGHQHAHALLSYDFDLKKAGHAYAIGCPSSSDAENGGCNIIEIKDPNHVTVQPYIYNSREGSFESLYAEDDKIELALERHRPVDSLTHNVRFEIKKYSYGNAEEEERKIWKSLQTGTNTRFIYMSGRKFADVREGRFEQISKLLRMNGDNRAEGTRIRLLFIDPELVKRLLDQANEGTAQISGLWGTREGLDILAMEAKMTLDELTAFMSNRLSLEERRRIDVRLSHTLLPFGSLVIDADKPWGKMAVKLLPIGAIGDLKAPILRLNRRQNRALYDFYLRHLKYLFLRGHSVEPCEFSDEDLLKDMHHLRSSNE